MKDPVSDAFNELDPVTAEGRAFILEESGVVTSNTDTVHGYDFNRGIDYASIVRSFSTVGFQVKLFVTPPIKWCNLSHF